MIQATVFVSSLILLLLLMVKSSKKFKENLNKISEQSEEIGMLKESIRQRNSESIKMKSLSDNARTNYESDIMEIIKSYTCDIGNCDEEIESPD